MSTEEVQQEVTETQLQEVAEEAAPTVDPLDQAAHMFMTSVPRIKALSANMKRNSLARVFKAIVEFPLAENYPKFKDKTESELFVLTLSAISAKNVMTNSFTGKQKEEIVQEATDGIVQELLTEEKANG